ncbi:MAG TPA: cupin domain-containing protein [Alphaproteobacteria bacterium]|nr:cupin domain-containing protein [Alphaproteobacteria bacterium]
MTRGTLSHAMPRFPDPGARPPAYHPAEEFLLDYAAGATSPAETLLLATHLAYCEACRRVVKTARTAGGALLDLLEPSRLPPNMLNRTLAAIDAGVKDEPPPPPPLSTLLARHMAHPHWKRLPNGFRMRRIPGQEGRGRAWLFDAPPNLKLLPHRHVGDEWTVILSGVFHDGDRAYQVGDFGVRQDGEEHQPFIGPEGRCVSLIMVRESPRYTTTIGRFAAPFVRL